MNGTVSPKSIEIRLCNLTDWSEREMNVISWHDCKLSNTKTVSIDGKIFPKLGKLFFDAVTISTNELKTFTGIEQQKHLCFLCWKKFESCTPLKVKPLINLKLLSDFPSAYFGWKTSWVLFCKWMVMVFPFVVHVAKYCGGLGVQSEWGKIYCWLEGNNKWPKRNIANRMNVLTVHW